MSKLPSVPAIPLTGNPLRDAQWKNWFLQLTKGMDVTNGGTGITSYVIGDLLYASNTTTLARLADIATGNALISGGVATAPSWGKIGLTAHVSGILPIANGGTAAATTNANIVFSGPSSGGAAAPSFRALVTGDLANDLVTYAKIQNVTDARLLGRSAGSAGDTQEITVGTGLSLAAGALTSTSSGTVTSVAVSGANGIGVSGSPIIASGTIALSLGAITPTSVATTGTVSVAMGTGAGTAIAVGNANVNTTSVGNIGAGTDDLITYSLPTNSLSAAGKGVRITAWGTKANNANAKTVTINFGSTVMASLAMLVGAAGQWSAQAVVISTGTDTQTYNATVQEHNTGFSSSLLIDHGVSTSAQDDGAAITIKCTGAATSNNDIVQTGLLVEFIG